jgi:hypothetical protein
LAGAEGAAADQRDIEKSALLDHRHVAMRVPSIARSLIFSAPARVPAQCGGDGLKAVDSRLKKGGLWKSVTD